MKKRKSLAPALNSFLSYSVSSLVTILTSHDSLFNKRANIHRNIEVLKLSNATDNELLDMYVSNYSI
jgi:hypothetical protein